MTPVTPLTDTTKDRSVQIPQSEPSETSLTPIRDTITDGSDQMQEDEPSVTPAAPLIDTSNNSSVQMQQGEPSEIFAAAVPLTETTVESSYKMVVSLSGVTGVSNGSPCCKLTAQSRCGKVSHPGLLLHH